MPRFRKAIVRRPTSNFGAGITSAGLGLPDIDRAIVQHEAYCRALEGDGIEVVRARANPAFPDGTFVEDVAITTQRGAVLLRPGAPSRLREAMGMVELLYKHFQKLDRIEH